MTASAQKKPDRPKVHADFYFGSIPPSRDAAKTMAQDKARLVMVGYHEGWSEDKIAKELKLTRREVDGIHGDLSDLGLLGRRTGDTVPGLLVVRDQDAEELKATLDRHTRDFALLVQSSLADVESMLSGLSGAQEVPMNRRLYATVVGGILFGGMIDVFTDDKTFMPAQRGKLQYYGWLVESDPSLAGKVRRDAWDSETYQIVSVGASLLEDRPQLDAVQRSGFVLNEPDARRFRTYALVTSRDKLLPFFKAQRDDLLKAHRRVESGRYSSFASFFAWYYTTLVNGSIDRLVTSGRLEAPADTYVYALKTPVR
jgi:hypothetical protein